MTSNKWFPVAEEITGSTPNMVWMMNENNQMPLFKPDMIGNDYLIEYTIYQDINLTYFPLLCKIAFLDALCRNQDRHIENIDFLISPSSKTIAPSYDTVLSLSNSFTESAMLGITSNKTYSNREIFSRGNTDMKLGYLRVPFFISEISFRPSNKSIGLISR